MTLYTSALETMERKLFAEQMEICGWNTSHAADSIGISKTTLRKRLKAYGITKPEISKRARRPNFYVRIPR